MSLDNLRCVSTQEIDYRYKYFNLTIDDSNVIILKLELLNLTFVLKNQLQITNEMKKNVKKTEDKSFAASIVERGKGAGREEGFCLEDEK